MKPLNSRGKAYKSILVFSSTSVGPRVHLNTDACGARLEPYREREEERESSNRAVGSMGVGSCYA